MSDHHKKLRELLTNVEARISNLAVFWLKHDHDYLLQAKKLAYNLIMQFQPEEMPLDQWRSYRDSIVRAIASNISGNDYRIYLDVPGELGADEDGPVEVTRTDLREWIRAGQRMEEGGKRITPEDEEILSNAYGEDFLVWRLANAYYGNRSESNYERMRDVIQAWVKEKKGAGDATTESFLRTGKIPKNISDALRDTWRLHFSLVIPIDYREWAKRVVKKKAVTRR